MRDANDSAVSEVLSGIKGNYLVCAKNAGVFTVHADRIGYTRATSQALNLAIGQTLQLALPLPAQPLLLEEIVVASKPRCADRPAERAIAARLWEEARRALAASLVSREQYQFQFVVEQYERDVTPRTLKVLREQSTTSRVVRGGRPFTARSAEQLADSGWLRTTAEGTIYYAPDERVLLADAFLKGHCFRLAESSDSLIALGFEPVRSGKGTDIRGALWLDRVTLELRHLDYVYTGLKLEVATDQIGGRVEFHRLPTGAWIARRWWVRTPVIKVVRQQRIGLRYDETRLTALRESGGSVQSILSSGSAVALDLDRARHAETDTAGRVIPGTVRAETDAAPVIALDSLPVVGRRWRMAGLAQFYDRAGRGIGRFVTRADIERVRPSSTSDIFRTVPGVTVHCRGPQCVLLWDRLQPRFGQTISGAQKPLYLLDGAPVDRSMACPIQYFVDGSPWQLEHIDQFRPDEIEGIEIYASMPEIPPRFRSPDARCGVIAIWLRERIP